MRVDLAKQNKKKKRINAYRRRQKKNSATAIVAWRTWNKGDKGGQANGDRGDVGVLGLLGRDHEHDEEQVGGEEHLEEHALRHADVRGQLCIDPRDGPRQHGLYDGPGAYGRHELGGEEDGDANPRQLARQAQA